jgi:hypothetical protein
MLHRQMIVLFLLTGMLVYCSSKKEAVESEWFAFKPSNTFAPGVLDMRHWLDAPAGKHGFVKMDGEDLVFEDGSKVKFWGTNICSSNAFADPVRVDSFVNFLAWHGVNAVRFHKFTWHAYHQDQSTEFSHEKFPSFDYFQSRLREKGIYYGWSHIYGHKVLPGDSSKMLAYSEIKNLSYPWAHLNGTTSSLVNFAPDLQELNIALTIDMLNHKNPYTGLRYADDPGLAFVEFQNEDNIFWSAIERALEQAPTYRSLLNRQFSQWLKTKYQSQKALESAWGKGNIPDGESLEKQNIYPQPNHSIFSREYETALKEKRPVATHFLDKMQFLYEKQMEFYDKFEKAVRATGYKGVLVGSCWQAGSGISHFYNLFADYNVGIIDRHNYFGGGAGGHRLDTGLVKNASMLSVPGSGLLSSGMQQVENRSFSFSEWMSLVPNQWTAESAPIIAVYGMGLQGWDASFSFATDIPRYSRFLESEGHGVYNATSPLHMGLYPALARMIYRGDIQESEIIATRNVHIPSMAKGQLGFEEIVDQGFDDKRFSGSVSSMTLAIGRIPVKFTMQPEETTIPDLSIYWDTINHVINSATNELTWNYGYDQYFTINTSGTKGVVGFTSGKTIVLDDWQITVDNHFAVVLITSLESDRNLKETNRILITAVARARNTGMMYSEAGDTLFTKGQNPLLMEPVQISLVMPVDIEQKVEVLDHDGTRTGKFIHGKNKLIKLNGSETQTLWYLVENK